MTNNIENIVLEHLVALRNDLKDFRSEVKEELQIIKLRLNSVERAVLGAHDDNVIVQMRIDRMDGKIERIEKRLELAA